MKKSLMALGAALLLLIVVLSVRACTNRAAERPQHAFGDLRVAEVVALRVAYRDDSVRVHQDGDLWLTDRGTPVDVDRVRNALERIRTLQTRELVSMSPDSARLVAYGLSPDEEKRVEWELASGERGQALIGATSGADFSSSFWKFHDSPEVYRTPGSITHDFPPRANNWEDRKYFPPFLYENVRSLEVWWVDEEGERHHYKIAQAMDGSARLVAPIDSALPPENAKAVLEQTPQFVIDGFIDASEPLAAELDAESGALIVETTLRDGTVHRFEAGAAMDEHHYARHPRVPEVITQIRQWRVDFFKKTLEELLEPPTERAPTLEDAIQTLPEPGSEEFYRMQQGM
jgi:hypothetical protein